MTGVCPPDPCDAGGVDGALVRPDASMRLDASTSARDAQPDDGGAVPADAADATLPPVEEADPVAELTACGAFSGVPDHWSAPDRDIELLALGDTQYASAEAGCRRAGGYRADQNAAMIEALNGIEAARWPSGPGFHREGLAFRRIRGVLLAGDLTENGGERSVGGPGGPASCGEYRAFREAFGLCADRDLRYPVYEGYGNHDFPFRSPPDDYHPVVGYIGRRSPHRPAITSFSPPASGRAHYSWDWDDIHFVNLNVRPAGTPGDPRIEIIDAGVEGVRRIDPQEALAFLDEDLAAHLRGSRQFVLMTHYGPSIASRLPREELDALCAVLRAHDARLVAWIHGHTHKSDVYEWTCAGRVTPVLNVGSPFYASADVDGRLHFAVVRLGNRWLEAVDVSVVPSSPTAYEIPGHTTPNASGDYNPDATWGGWAVRYPIDPPVP